MLRNFHLLTFKLGIGESYLFLNGAWQLRATEWNVSMSGWLIILYMGFLAAGVAFCLNLYGINKIGSGKASVFNNMQHVFSIILSVIILKESRGPFGCRDPQRSLRRMVLRHAYRLFYHRASYLSSRL